jgi:hypothetical protein
MKKLSVLIGMAIIILNFNVFGQEGYHEHDGFFLRMLYGFGYADLTEEDVLGSDLKYSGFAQDLRFQIGGTVANNLILFGEFGGNVQIDPQMEWMNMSATAEDVTVSVFGFGGGLTYYVMPTNFFFSLSFLSSQATFEFEGTTGESQYGFGMYLMMGKEWWVGKDWGLGVSLYGCYNTMNDEGSVEGINYSSDINHYSIGAMFSATYN